MNIFLFPNVKLQTAVRVQLLPVAEGCHPKADVEQMPSCNYNFHILISVKYMHP